MSFDYIVKIAELEAKIMLLECEIKHLKRQIEIEKFESKKPIEPMLSSFICLYKKMCAVAGIKNPRLYLDHNLFGFKDLVDLSELKPAKNLESKEPGLFAEYDGVKLINVKEVIKSNNKKTAEEPPEILSMISAYKKVAVQNGIKTPTFILSGILFHRVVNYFSGPYKMEKYCQYVELQELHKKIPGAIGMYDGVLLVRDPVELATCP